jgi:L-lysine exporter family protein LysE/ArgO
MESIFLEGFFLQASLIFALGAQNLFVLESGLNGRHPLLISLSCFICDFSLIMVGVAGTATLLTEFQQIKILFGLFGIIFMVIHGINKIRLPLESPDTTSVIPVAGPWRAVLLSFTFSILNPHAYLDAIVLIGGYSTKYSELGMRMALGVGAACFSLVWFLMLSFGARSVKPFFENQRSSRFLSSLAGLLLIFLAGKLSTDVYNWVEIALTDSECKLIGKCSPAPLIQAEVTEAMTP